MGLFAMGQNQKYPSPPPSPRVTTENTMNTGAGEREQSGDFDEAVLLRKNGYRKKKDQVLHRNVSGLERFPLPVGEG
jgi:hypothetical protein